MALRTSAPTCSSNRPTVPRTIRPMPTPGQSWLVKPRLELKDLQAQRVESFEYSVAEND